MNPVVTVIVPVYRVEKYIHKCIDSILSQTFKDIEVILVDDGSPDKCGTICDNYAEQDQRVYVIHQNNGGLSAARNTGIKCAKGEYLFFVDSDDWIEPSMIERLYLAIVKDNADMAICDFRRVTELGNFTDMQPHLLQETISGREGLQKIANYDVRFVVAWNKLYRRSLFSKILYPTGRLHEDEFIAHRLFDICEKITVIPDVLYNYLVRENSITQSKYSVTRLDGLEAACQRYQFLKEKKYCETLIPCKKFIAWQYCVATNSFQPKTREEKARLKAISLLVKQVYKDSNSNIDFVSRLMFVFPKFYWNYKQFKSELKQIIDCKG